MTLVSHLFYHQEKVEPLCALNSWRSIRDHFGAEEEVVILDLGATLSGLLPLSVRPKFVRFEQVRTDRPPERSYTYGLNLMVPQLRGEWVLLWRSDYVYHADYHQALREALERADVVVPYEAFIGAWYCTARWVANRWRKIYEGTETYLLKHASVCPVYEFRDYAHFALRKSFWLRNGGMAEALWGYGSQFPEFFLRLEKSAPQCRVSVQPGMIAFHQAHRGSFGQGGNDRAKQQEIREAREKERRYFGSEEARQRFLQEVRQQPLQPRRPAPCYELKRQPPSLACRIRWRLERLAAGRRGGHSLNTCGGKAER